MAARVLTSSKKLLCGLAVTDVGLQDQIVGWVSEIAKSGPNEPLRNLHLLLFDTHSKALPLKFLERQPTSMVLVETVQQSASMQREFVAKHLSSGVSPTLLAAFHSSFKDLLVPSKSKPYNERFLQTIFLPDREYFKQAGVEDSQIETVAVGCLPSPTLQRSLLNSLYAQWLVFVHNEVAREFGRHYSTTGGDRKKAGEAAKSVYEIADFTLVTFLHSAIFAQLVCGKYDPDVLVDGKRLPAVDWRDRMAELAPRPMESSLGSNDTPLPSAAKCTKKSAVVASGPLSFFAKSYRHFSFMFNLLFDVRLLNGWDGFPVRQLFAPIPADPKKSGHADKLEKLGIKHSDFYAVSVRPRALDNLMSVTAAYGIDLLSDDEAIMRFAFWLTDLTPKLRGTKSINDELRMLLPGVTPVFPSDRLVNEVSPVEFLIFYPNFMQYFTNEITPVIQQQYNAFYDQFLKASERNYVD